MNENREAIDNLKPGDPPLKIDYTPKEAREVLHSSSGQPPTNELSQETSVMLWRDQSGRLHLASFQPEL